MIRPLPTNPSGGPYSRPNLHLDFWWFMPHHVKATALYGVAWGAITILIGVRVWRALTEHDETED